MTHDLLQISEVIATRLSLSAFAPRLANTSSMSSVTVSQTYSVQSLCGEEITLDYLYGNALSSEDDCLRWFATYSVLKNERQCKACIYAADKIVVCAQEVAL